MKAENKRKHSIVITTINKPNDIVCSISMRAKDHNWELVIVGDQNTPNDFEVDSATYLSLEAQLKSNFKLAKLLPTGHYSRKNIGYLHAMQSSTGVIIDTDDDNSPSEEFWIPRKKLVTVKKMQGDGWVNIYEYFSDMHVWPRGFTLQGILQEPLKVNETGISTPCVIQQALVDGDPDVDAIYRLTDGKGIVFKKMSPICIHGAQRCPFNSQNTTWWPEAWVFLYLPSFCNFRLTDIWRSFVAQSYLLRNGFAISFHASDIWQYRNPHDLLKDFQDEVPGYLHNAEIMELLDSIPCDEGQDAFLRKSYGSLAKTGLIGQQEKRLVEAWINDVNSLKIGCN